MPVDDAVALQITKLLGQHLSLIPATRRLARRIARGLQTAGNDVAKLVPVVDEVSDPRDYGA